MKRKILMCIVLIFFLSVNKTNVSAGWAHATAVLKANQKEVSSSYAVFSINTMDCSVTSASEYPIKFISNGRTDTSVSQSVIEKSVIYNVNCSGTEDIVSAYNLHAITLRGWNINSSVKGCIGYGALRD